MRTIQFRAFHKEDKTMHSVVRLDFYANCALIRLENGRHREVDLSELELMQFTGLYDKNGKEVFEGDLLINEDEGSTPREVVFENGAFCIKFNDGSLGRLTQWEINRLKKEIIGNIHENELLEQ